MQFENKTAIKHFLSLHKEKIHKHVKIKPNFLIATMPFLITHAYKVQFYF